MRGDGENLYRRGKTWWGRVQVNGRDVRRSLRTHLKAEARERLEAMLRDARHARYYGENRKTWKEAVIAWAENASTTLRPNTLKRYIVSIRRVRGTLDDLYLDEIDLRTIAKLARRAGVSNATRRRDLTAVSVVLRWCVGNGWREDNPAAAWDRRVIVERREPIVLPDDYAIECVVAEAPGNLARMIRFAQYTGMRQEEIASLEWPQVDRQRQVAMLLRTKTGRARAVPLDDRVLGTLAGTAQYLGSGFVFYHGAGLRYRNVASRFAAISRRAVAKAKTQKRPIPARFRFHDLRHWHAVDYLRRGGSIYTLQQILGHSSIKTTEIYLDYLTPAEKEVAKGGSAQNGAQ